MGRRDEDLIRELKEGNEEAFEIIYYGYKNLIHYIVRTVAKCGLDAEDLVQEVFMKVSANIDKYNDSFASFKAWIATIARNHALDYFRTKKHVIYNDDLVYNVVDETTVYKPTRFSVLHGVLEDKEVDFLVFKIVFNFSHKELAQLYDVSIDVSKKYLKKAKTKAMEEWKKYENDFQ